MRLGKVDAIGKREVGIIRARQKNFPSVRREQRLNTPRPVERKFFFKSSVRQTVRADICAAMAGIEHEHTIGSKGQRFVEQQRLQIFLQIETVNENLVVNDFGRKTEVHCQTIPTRLAAADFQNHCAVVRTNGIAGDRRIRNFARRGEFIFHRPTVERSPSQNGRGWRNFLRRRNRMNGWRRNRFDNGVRRQIFGRIPFYQRGLDDLIRQRPFAWGWLRFRTLINAVAAREEQQHSAKNDSRKFEHAPIVRKQNADSSCFRFFS